MARSGKQRRDIEPITAISVVIFILAAVSVSSLSVYNNYFAEDEGAVVIPGSDVSVEYTGSLYEYFDDEGALIFDTNIKAHTTEDYDLVGGFNKKTFKPLPFVQGEGKVLKGFENAVLGKKVGDTIRVTITENSDIYKSENKQIPSTLSFDKITYMDADSFNILYKDVNVVEGAGKVTFDTVYGWEATAIYDSNIEKVMIDNLAVKTTTYGLLSNEGQLGDVKLKVTDIVAGTHGDEIKCTMSVEPEPEHEDYMLWVDLGYENFYVFGDGDLGKLKITSNPALEGDIYFVITIKSIS